MESNRSDSSLSRACKKGLLIVIGLVGWFVPGWGGVRESQLTRGLHDVNSFLREYAWPFVHAMVRFVYRVLTLIRICE